MKIKYFFIFLFFLLIPNISGANSNGWLNKVFRGCCLLHWYNPYYRNEYLWRGAQIGWGVGSLVALGTAIWISGWPNKDTTGITTLKLFSAFYLITVPLGCALGVNLKGKKEDIKGEFKDALIGGMVGSVIPALTIFWVASRFAKEKPEYPVWIGCGIIALILPQLGSIIGYGWKYRPNWKYYYHGKFQIYYPNLCLNTQGTKINIIELAFL